MLFVFAEFRLLIGWSHENPWSSSHDFSPTCDSTFNQITAPKARFFCLTDFIWGIWRHLDLAEFYYHIPTSSKFSLATCPAMCKALLAKLERSWAREANSRWGEFEGPIDGATPWCHLDVIRQWLENHLESCPGECSKIDFGWIFWRQKEELNTFWLFFLTFEPCA